MTFEEYKRRISSTELALRKNLGEARLDILHMLIGIQTELGELMDIYKKELAYGKPIDRANLIEEMGDLMFYQAELMNLEGVSSSEVFSKNIEKLTARYKSTNRTFEENALNRDLEKERKILERGNE